MDIANTNKMQERNRDTLDCSHQNLRDEMTCAALGPPISPPTVTATHFHPILYGIFLKPAPLPVRDA